ncbi:hypothetical protein OH77DRAFT_1516744 [Trametes cingulata]|nr:hypothetical protein OH77DRAFT_1516744 [Trametes cingulata]
MAAAALVAAPVQPPQPAVATADQGPEDKPSEAQGAPAGTPPQNAGKGKGLRALRERLPLRRAFSTKHASLSTPTLLSPLSPVDAEGDEASAPAAKPRTKLTAFERFVNSKLNARKGGKKTKGAAEAGDADEAPVVVDLEPAPSSASTSSRPEGEQVEALPTISEAVPTTEAPAAGVEQSDAAGPDPAPEPLPLARKIQSLLSSLPPFLSPLSPSTTPSTPATDPSGGDSNGQNKQTDGETDPSAPSTIDNSRLISLLSSPSIMNGSLSRGRQSVWALLDNLRLKSLASPSTASGGQSATTESTGNADAQDLAPVEDDDSVMFYGPLVPDANSEVELARSEIVSVDENGTIVDILLDDAPLPDAPPKARFGGIWPFSSTAASSAAPSPAKPKPKVLVEKRVWVPSTTKLSLQVMWWGYRLWLPPPIMNLLNDKEIEAAKLGAMLTTALQWLLNNVPDSALPATLRPALALVKSLVPYLGYIGGFVAWSWGAIRGFDIGNGVTLTATWLLPIALIPGTWEDSDVPQPQPHPQPQPAPPAQSPPPISADPSSDPGSNPSQPSTGDPSSPAPNPSQPASGDPSSPGSSPSVPSGGSTTSPTSPAPPASDPTTPPTTTPPPAAGTPSAGSS